MSKYYCGQYHQEQFPLAKNSSPPDNVQDTAVCVCIPGGGGGSQINMTGMIVEIAEKHP